MLFSKHILVLATVLSLAGAGNSRATEESGYAQICSSHTNVFLGQVFTVDFIVKAPRPPSAPDLGNLPGFHVTALVPGKATDSPDTYLFRYAFRAERAGDLTIPPLRFGNQATRALVVHARKPAPSSRMKLESTLSATSVFVGEPVEMTTVWDSTIPFGTLKAVDFSFPILGDPRFRVLDPYEPDKENQKEATGLPVQGTRILAIRRNYEQDGKLHQTLQFRKILVPLKSGPVSIPPATLLCAVPQGAAPTHGYRGAFQYPAYFDNTFFDRNLSGNNYRRIYAESPPLALEVKPLPAEGRPDLFQGLVGEFSIAVSAAPLSVHEGDPITLAITVSTPRHPEAISLPPLRYQPGLAGRFRIPDERSLPQVTDHAKIYTQTVRPLSSGIREIPALQLAFFNPASNAYAVVRSKPIPIKVEPAKSVAAYARGGRFHTTPRATEGGIRQNHAGPDLLKSRRAPLLGWTSPLLVAAILLLPPLLAVGTVFLRREKRRILRTTKAARAYRTYRKNTARILRDHRNKSGIYRDLDRVLRAYLGDRLHLAPGALALGDVLPHLVRAGVDPRVQTEFQQLFLLCETYRFTSAYDEPADTQAIVREANRIVKSIERCLK